MLNTKLHHPANVAFRPYRLFWGFLQGKELVIFILAITCFTACQKEELEDQKNTGTPVENQAQNKGFTITTSSVYVGSAISAYAYGTISSNGGGNSVLERGFCFSTASGPTISDDTVHSGWASGSYGAGLPGLSPGTTYYVRAYAFKQNHDAVYGNELTFTTLTLGLPSPGVGDVTDIDGNVYHTITLGTQVWMVENLKTTRYRDGSAIANVTDNTAWGTLTTGAYCDYNNTPANSAEYGRLYNSFAATDSRNIAPAGWHVPSPVELQTLFNYLGGGGIAGGRMKETGFTHWLSPNTGADNTSGFTALGSGERTVSGAFYGLQAFTGYWSSSTTTFIAYYLRNDSQSHSFSFGFCPDCFRYGFSVRCVKD